MRDRRLRGACALACAFIALLGATAPVAADRLNWAHEAFTNCVGTTDSHVVTYPVIRADVGPMFKNKQTLTFRILFVEQPANGTLSASITDTKVTTPSTWRSKALGSVSSGTMSIKLTFKATKQFTDGGRVRLLINGDLESIDVPTIVMCTAPTAQVDAPSFGLVADASPAGGVPIVVLILGGIIGAGLALLAGRRLRFRLAARPLLLSTVGLVVGVLASTPLALNLAGAGGPGATSGPTAAAQASIEPTAVAQVSAAPSLVLPFTDPTPGVSSPPTASPIPTAIPPSLPPRPAVGAAGSKLAATTDLYFLMDVDQLPLGRLVFEPLTNDVGPDAAAIRITKVTQLRIPAHYIHTGDTGTANVGTLSIVDDGARLEWTDDVCRTVTSLCYNLPPLRFTYTISDGSTSDSGIGWVKFDRPWLIPFDYDRNLIVVPAAEAENLAVGIPLPVVAAENVSVHGLPGVKLTVFEPCPSDPKKGCLIDVTAPSSGQVAGLMRPVSTKELNAFVTFSTGVDVGGGKVAILGMASFGTPGECLIMRVDYPDLGFSGTIKTGCWDATGAKPVNVRGYGRRSPAKYTPMMDSFGVYIANLSVPTSCDKKCYGG